MLQLQTTDVVIWLAQASCRFLVGACHIPENERTDCLYDGERGKGEVEYFCSQYFSTRVTKQLGLLDSATVEYR